MTRDEIKALIPDITDEALGKVLDINGKDITKAKGKSDEYKTQLDTVKADLTTAQDTIKSLEASKGDVTALQAEIDKYKQAEADRAQAEKDAAESKALSDRFDSVIGENKFINDFTKNGILTEFKQALENEENKGKGDKDIYDTIIKDRDGIFISPNTVGGIPGMGNVGGAASDDQIRSVMGLPPVNKK